MSKFSLLTGVLALMAGTMFTSCSSDEEMVSSQDKVTTTFYLGLDPQSRAAETLNLSAYDAKLYLYEGRSDDGGSIGYVQVKELTIEDNYLEIEDLEAQAAYKAVFLAIPKGQTPSLPALYGQGITPDYENSIADYINGNYNDTDNDIFRSIVTFIASTANSQQSTILTRQNGALEVRIKNMPDMTSVELHVNGQTQMYLNDGTGGVVKTGEITVPLLKTVTENLTSSEVRIKINLLPQEDITDQNGEKNYLVINTANETKKYPIKSDQGVIPIYPNQVTWLTLGNDSGNFDVNFSGNINLDDNDWDGWNVINNKAEL